MNCCLLEMLPLEFFGHKWKGEENQFSNTKSKFLLFMGIQE